MVPADVHGRSAGAAGGDGSTNMNDQHENAASDDGTADIEVVSGEIVWEAGSDAESTAGGGFGLGGGLDLGSMLQMAQDMGQRMQEAQEELASTEVVGTAGGGIVEVTLNGHLHLVGVRIDPSAVDRDDPTLLEDLILAAWSDARDGVAALQAQADPLGGLGDPGGLLGDLGGLLGGA